jgi:hypothetical protein
MLTYYQLHIITIYIYIIYYYMDQADQADHSDVFVKQSPKM